MATKAIKATTAYGQILKHEEIRRDSPETINLSPGDAYPQGDIIIACIDSEPTEAGEYPGRQLAPGATQGSRHIAEGNCRLYRPDEDSATTIIRRLFPRANGYPQIVGPTVVATGNWTVTHPEHGHRTFGPGVYQVTYQRQYAEDLRRVED